MPSDASSALRCAAGTARFADYAPGAMSGDQLLGLTASQWTAIGTIVLSVTTFTYVLMTRGLSRNGLGRQDVQCSSVLRGSWPSPCL